MIQKHTKVLEKMILAQEMITSLVLYLTIKENKKRIAIDLSRQKASVP